MDIEIGLILMPVSEFSDVRAHYFAEKPKERDVLRTS
jgi:hypothetical protein